MKSFMLCLAELFEWVFNTVDAQFYLWLMEFYLEILKDLSVLKYIKDKNHQTSVNVLFVHNSSCRTSSQTNPAGDPFSTKLLFKYALNSTKNSCKTLSFVSEKRCKPELLSPGGMVSSFYYPIPPSFAAPHWWNTSDWVDHQQGGEI